MIRTALILSLIWTSLGAAIAGPLNFFKNYFITGDYVVAGVGLSGKGIGSLATGNIVVNGVPPNAGIVSAFLYWQTVELRDGEGKNGKFRGFNIVGKPLGNRTSPCWSSGGAAGSPNGSHAVRVYRTDVLRYLPAAGGVRLANGSHSVSLPDSGGGNQSPVAGGVSLVIVYRDPSMPLKAVVLYDGAFTMDQSNDSFHLPLQGFYQASTANPAARLTHVVSDGQLNFSERLLFNGALIATNPFVAAQGESWDNPTFDVSALVPGDASSVNTTVDRSGLSSFDCLSWSAVVFSTTVQDTDRDALLDTWETNGLTEISDGTFVDLPAMGANPNIRDVFLEIDYMSAASHSHKPKQAALDMVSAAFLNAPVPIRLHFDLGQGGPYNAGGDIIPEVPTDQFTGYSGVVGWKTGFRALKDQYFRHNRKDIFRYVVFAHALGLPNIPPGNPAIPRTTSGIADLPGGDFLVTFGLWRSDVADDDQTGSVQQQAGTLMHELGHTLYLRHGGFENTPGCKPNYQSVMNYLFQIRGLTKASGETVVDYSRAALAGLNETALLESAGLGNTLYRARWYAPPGYLDRYLSSFGSRFATRHCDGSPLSPLDSQMVKVDSLAVGGFIDWNNDGIQSAVTAPLDVNFSGASEAVLTGSDDWLALDLRHVGARRNARGLSGDIASGDIASGDIASGDIASGDIASGDIASGDIASGDIASGVFDQLDIDFETFNSLVEAPTGLTAVASNKAITLNWTSPTAGQIRQFSIYRAVGVISPANLPALIGTVAGTPPAATFVDGTVKNNVTYTYFVTALNAAGVQSTSSNTVIIKK